MSCSKRLMCGFLVAELFWLAGAAFAQSPQPSRAPDAIPASPYGPDDLLGAANNLSPAGVLEAARLVKTGTVYSLGQTVDAHANRGQRTYSVVIIQPGSGDGAPMFDNSLTVNDDLVIAWQGLGTRIDGFAHVGIDHRHYNGVPAAAFVRRDGLLKFGVESIPPMVTRGILLDIAALKQVDHLGIGQVITVEDLEAAQKREGVRIGKGDVVLIHTGWQQQHSHDPDRGLDEPGLGVAGARYLAQHQVVAVGADTEALDVVPAEVKGQYMPVHQELLVKSGVYIIQDVVTRELARDRVYAFLFILGQPKLKGAVTAIVNPLAIR